MIDVPNAPTGGVARRAIDIAVATAALLVSAPVLAAAAALIKLEDGGPILYRRRVLGSGGIEFDAFKLRTMRPDADRWLHTQPELLAQYQLTTKLTDDPRVTHLGRALRRCHVDELPQLVNVLAGQMSIVGPRIIHPTELARYGEFGTARMSIRPGMTGLWQVARSTYSYDERLRLDRFYLYHRSLPLDLRILLLTIPAVFGWRSNIVPTTPDAVSGH